MIIINLSTFLAFRYSSRIQCSSLDRSQISRYIPEESQYYVPKTDKSRFTSCGCFCNWYVELLLAVRFSFSQKNMYHLFLLWFVIVCVVFVHNITFYIWVNCLCNEGFIKISTKLSFFTFFISFFQMNNFSSNILFSFFQFQIIEINRVNICKFKGELSRFL